jgi:hypothetical protein
VLEDLAGNSKIQGKLAGNPKIKENWREIQKVKENWREIQKFKFPTPPLTHPKSKYFNQLDLICLQYSTRKFYFNFPGNILETFFIEGCPYKRKGNKF